MVFEIGLWLRPEELSALNNSVGKKNMETCKRSSHPSIRDRHTEFCTGRMNAQNESSVYSPQHEEVDSSRKKNY